MAGPQQLTRFLHEEIALQKQHCQHLEAQQQALISCDREAFRALQEAYPALIARLEAQANLRINALSESGQPVTLNAVLEKAPEGKRQRLCLLRDELRRLLERAQALCSENRQLIENELCYIDFSLDIFVEAGRRADSAYGGGGQWGRRKLLDRGA